MKSTLKVLLAFLMFGLVASSPVLHAQPPGGGQRGQRGQGGRGRGGALTVEAIETAVGKLTDDQKTKITAILAKLTKDTAALDQADRRTKGMELRTAAMKDIRALLTDDQAKKFDAMQAQGRGGRGGRRGGNAAPNAAP